MTIDGQVTRIDFYTGASDKVGVACRIAAKAMSQKLRVLILAADEAMLARVDRELWMQPAVGFVPHCRANAAIAAETPVLLSIDAGDPPHDQVLVNLHDATPSTFARFKRLVEIVSQDDSDKQRARDRFRYYKDRGYEIKTHDLAAPGGR